jgi:hypothetical protein
MADIRWRGWPRPGLAGAVDLERFSSAGDGASVRACHEIYLSGRSADDPEGPAQSFRFFAGDQC